MTGAPTGAADRRWLRWRLARRISQAVFLLGFLWLILLTASVAGPGFDASASEIVAYPVEIFLNIDPLAGAVALLSTRTIPGAMIWGLVVLGSAMLLGRVFCGWVCPMGTMNHLASELLPALRGKRRIDANRTRPYQKLKYLILLAVLGAAVFGSAMGGLLDPICLATRGVALTVLPWVAWAAGSSLGAASEDGGRFLSEAADRLYDLAGGFLVHGRGLLVAGGFLLAAVFVGVLAANRVIPRFWCRGLCPLGALLGLSGRFGLLSLKKDRERCTSCGQCQLHCSGAASPEAGSPWQRAECDLCMNCVAACGGGALQFGLAAEKTDEQPLPDLGRRSVILGAATGAVLVPAMRTGALGSPLGRPDPDCIRPPGALDESDFLARCIRCGQCMKICPNNALHPAVHEAGVEGLWTPVLIPRIGYCEPTCTLCTEVCPTGAIRTITQKQKTGQDPGPMVRIGTAFIDRGRCLPWAMGTPCIVCEEFCPVSPKAVWFAEEEAELRGKAVRLKLPRVDPAACNGCGACENVCPVHDRAAIRVTSAGESRSPKNALLLKRPPK